MHRVYFYFLKAQLRIFLNLEAPCGYKGARAVEIWVNKEKMQSQNTMKCGDTTSLQFNRTSVTKTDNRNIYLICCNKLYAGFHNKGLNQKNPLMQPNVKK
jgi:hypothetical protein